MTNWAYINLRISEYWIWIIADFGYDDYGVYKVMIEAIGIAILPVNYKKLTLVVASTFSPFSSSLLIMAACPCLAAMCKLLAPPCNQKYFDWHYIYLLAMDSEAENG